MNIFSLFFKKSQLFQQETIEKHLDARLNAVALTSVEQHIALLNHLNLEIIKVLNFINAEHIETRNYINSQFYLSKLTNAELQSKQDKILSELQQIHANIVIEKITATEKLLLEKRIL